ncbi:hypothetical protein SprV_0301305500 [Sparganum proliferum]
MTAAVPTLAPISTTPTLTLVAPNPCATNRSRSAPPALTLPQSHGGDDEHNHLYRPATYLNAPGAPSTTNTFSITTPTSRDVDWVTACPHCDHTFISRIVLHWFKNNDAANSDLLAKKNRLHKAYVDHPTGHNRAAFYRSHRLVQRRMQVMQEAWTARKGEEIQRYADLNEWENFFSAIKTVYDPIVKGSDPLLNADGTTLLSEKTQILK